MNVEMRFDAERLRKAVARVPDALDADMRKALITASFIVSDRARQLIEARLNVRTGNLRNSTYPRPVTGNFTAGTLQVEVKSGGAVAGSGGRVVYAAAHEYGRPAWVVKPVHRKALRWPTGRGGKETGFVFSRGAHRIPRLPAKHFMRDALRQTQRQVFTLLQDAYTNGFRKVF